MEVACQIVTLGCSANRTAPHPMKVLQPWLRAHNFDHDGTHVLHVCSLPFDWQVGESLRKLEGWFLWITFYSKEYPILSNSIHYHYIIPVIIPMKSHHLQIGQILPGQVIQSGLILACATAIILWLENELWAFMVALLGPWWLGDPPLFEPHLVEIVGCFFLIPKVRHIDDLVGRLGWFFFFSLQIYSPQRWEILMRLRKYWDYSYVDLSNDRECTNMAIHCLWDFGWFWRSRF